MSTQTPDAPAPAPAPAPHVVRPGAPVPVLAGAAVVGLAAAVVVPDRALGLGFLLLALLAVGTVVRLSGWRPRGWSAVHAVLALLLTGSVVVRDAEWLVVLDLLAAAALASLALTPARSWPGVLRGVVAVPRELPRAIGWAARGSGALSVPAAGPAVRGLLLTAVLLLVFVPLLVSADAVFADRLTALLPGAPDVGVLPARVVAGLLAAAGTCAAVLVVRAPRPQPVVSAATRGLRRTVEWALPLWSLVLLLGAFLAVQAEVLLGGDDHVLRSAGVTYASYARQGFGQLLAVTALVLAVVAAAVRWAPRAARPALASLCALALVVDASAFARLQLYGEAYGLTRLRITATTVTLGLAVVLVLVLVAGVRPGAWLPHGVALTVGAALLLLTAADPDARIAQSGVARGAQADVAYLSGLSADAAPVLDRLPEPARSCALRDTGARVASAPADLLSANLSRARAGELLRRRPLRPALC